MISTLEEVSQICFSDPVTLNLEVARGDQTSLLLAGSRKGFRSSRSKVLLLEWALAKGRSLSRRVDYGEALSRSQGRAQQDFLGDARAERLLVFVC
ncbi:hypothetical protein DY000_02038210 [Brassica cretica]|uniref:Uncharacterized protein n=1 Tax=Brassica cretica TaxID=69181 RepID=A0ABQ7BAI8_BRACR|nr:hypothetical protein DY000_02038210 [Brassica cretica]